jgi:hypothetical protein
MLIGMSSPRSIPREKTLAFLPAASRRAAVALIGAGCCVVLCFGLFGLGSSASAAPAASAEPAFVAPLPSPLQMLRRFDPPAQPWLAGNRGVDLAARAGEPVFAAGAGTVLYAGLLAGRGVISIDHGGLRTTYEPVDPLIGAGALVSAGQLIAQVSGVADTCGPPGTCLHWGAIEAGRYIDPMSLLQRPSTVRLLPIWGATPAPSVNAALGPKAGVPSESAPNGDETLLARNPTAAPTPAVAPERAAAPTPAAAASKSARRRSAVDMLGRSTALAGGAGAAIAGLASLRRPRPLRPDAPP